MTARRHHRGDKAAGRRASKGEALRQAPEEPAFDMYKESLAGWEKERACQRGIFEANREEILAAHPGKHIAVCEGKVVVADTVAKLDQEIMRNHLGHPAFFCTPVSIPSMFGRVSD